MWIKYIVASFFHQNIFLFIHGWWFEKLEQIVTRVDFNEWGKCKLLIDIGHEPQPLKLLKTNIF